MGIGEVQRFVTLGVAVADKVGDGVRKSLVVGVLGEWFSVGDIFLEFKRFNSLATASMEMGCCPLVLSQGP